MARATTVAIVALVAGLSLAAFGWRQLDDRSAPPIVIEDPRADATIVVAIAGAVATPGLYALGGDARMQDALDRAGGTVAGADLAAINPAQRLQDEQRIVVPRLAPTAGPRSTEEAVTAASGGADMAQTPAPSVPTVRPTTSAPTPAAPVGVAVAGDRIDINRATAAELDALPGIGPVIAQRIVDYRAANGPFAAVDALVDIQGISARMVEDLRPLVTVGP